MNRLLIPLTVLMVAVIPGLAQTQETNNLDKLWSDLADVDATKAYRAIWALAKTPKEIVALIAAKLEPAVAPDPKFVEGLIHNLNSETFTLREKASKELLRIGDLAEPALRKALAANPDLEGKLRLEKILERMVGPITLPEQLRVMRAVEVLENIGSDAKTLLAKYSGGAPGAMLTREASEAFERLAKAEPLSITMNPAPTDIYGDQLPEGAVRRLGTVRFRQDMTVDRQGLAFIENEKAIVSFPVRATGLPALRDNGIKVWETHSGRLLRTLKPESLGISACAVAADGKTLVIACSARPVNTLNPSEIRIFDLLSGNLVHSFTYNSGGLTRNVALSADGRILSSLRSGKGQRDSFLQIEEIVTKKILAQKSLPPADSNKMALSGDGKYLAVMQEGRDLLIWDWASGEVQSHTLEFGFTLNELNGGGITFSHDGRFLAAISWRGELEVRQMPSGRLLYKREPDSHVVNFAMPSFSADSKTLAWVTHDNLADKNEINPVTGRFAIKNDINLLDAATGRQNGILEDVGVLTTSPMFSADGKTLAFGNTRSALAYHLWDLESRREITPEQGHTSIPQHLLVSATGQVASADAKEIRLWNPLTSKSIGKIPLKHALQAFALSPDASRIAWSGTGDVIHVFDQVAGKEVLGLNGHGAALAFSADGLSLHSFGNDFKLRLWDLKTGRAVQEQIVRPKNFNLPTDEKKLVAIGLNTETTPFLSPGGKTLLFRMFNTGYIYDTITRQETSQFPLKTRSSVQNLALSADGRFLLSEGGRVSMNGEPPHKSVVVTNLATGKIERRFQVPNISAGSMAFSRDGRMFAAASEIVKIAKFVEGAYYEYSSETPQKEILLYEIASGNLRGIIRGLPAKVTSLAFFPDGRHLATGMGDSTILIWDLTKLKPLAEGP